MSSKHLRNVPLKLLKTSLKIKVAHAQERMVAMSIGHVQI